MDRFVFDLINTQWHHTKESFFVLQFWEIALQISLQFLELRKVLNVSEY